MEDVVKGLKGDDAPLGVGGCSSRVGLDAGNAGFLGRADLIGRDARVEVEGHEVVDGWVDGLEVALVF